MGMFFAIIFGVIAGVSALCVKGNVEYYFDSGTNIPNIYYNHQGFNQFDLNPLWYK